MQIRVDHSVNHVVRRICNADCKKVFGKTCQYSVCLLYNFVLQSRLLHRHKGCWFRSFSSAEGHGRNLYQGQGCQSITGRRIMYSTLPKERDC